MATVASTRTTCNVATNRQSDMGKPANPSDRIRLLQVTYGHSMGGSESLAATIGASLDKQRFLASFAAMTDDGEIGTRLRDQGYSTTTLGRSDGFDPAALWRVWNFLRQNPTDIVQTHHAGSLVYFGPPARIQGAKIVHTEHDIHSFKRLPNEFRWLKRLASLPHAYVAIDPAIAAFLQDEFRIPPRKIHVIRNGIDLAKFHPPQPFAPAKRTGDPFLVGWVARLDSPKRPDVFVDALAILAEQDPLVQGCIIGPGDLLAQTRQRAVAAGIADRIEFLGARNDVPEQLRRFDCYVLCSENEGLPISLIEAMATQLPCVVSSVGGIPDLITDGLQAFLLPDLSPETLADRIRQIRQQPALAKDMGYRAAELAKTTFDLKHTIQQYQQLFESLLEKPKDTQTRPIRTALKQAAYDTIAKTNPERWFRRKQNDTLLVVGYHGVTRRPDSAPSSWLLLPEVEFERQILALKQNFEIISMSQAAKRLAEGVPFQTPTACVTFDDGYKNNLTIAAPILAKHQVPATFYLATGLIGTSEVLWMPRLELALQASLQPKLDLSDFALDVYPLREAAYSSFLQILFKLYRMPEDNRAAVLQAIWERAEVDPLSDMGEFEMMSWNDVATLENLGPFEFGGHTVSHQIVKALDDEQLEFEIGQSIRDVAAHTHTAPITFACPNGTAEDFDDRAKAVLKRHGVLAAVSTIEGINTSRSDRFALRRITVGSNMKTAEFRLHASGLIAWTKEQFGLL